MKINAAQKCLAKKAQLLQSKFQITKDTTIFELSLEFLTPLIISESKADIPMPGLPNLDGILKFVSYYWCVKEATLDHPEMTNECLMQINQALHGNGWIDFPIPLRPIALQNPGIGQSRRVYDCSIGLPLDPKSNNVVYPIGNNFLDEDGNRLERIIDSIPLRRRSVSPWHSHRQVDLCGRQFDTSRGAYKSLDNRIYILVTKGYRFYFRGDSDCVYKLLKMMKESGIGIGKKTSLGYGQIKSVSVRQAPESVKATLGHPMTKKQKIALSVEPDTKAISLLKNIPIDELFYCCSKTINDDYNQYLFGQSNIKILSYIPVLAGYTSPNWLKNNQALVARYGSLLYSSD